MTVGRNTGFVDVALDPSNRHRVRGRLPAPAPRFTLIDGGPESAIYKYRRGATWNKLKSGLPTVDWAIGLSISPADPNVVYATIEAAG